MDTETRAKKAAILLLMHGYPSSADRITQDVIDAYLDAVEKCSSDAVTRSCQQFSRGLVEGHNNAFPPTAAQIAANASQWDYAIATITAGQEMRKLERVISYPIGQKPPPPAEPMGPIKLEIGGRMVDVSRLTLEQKNEAMRTGKLPDDKPKSMPSARLRKMGDP